MQQAQKQQFCQQKTILTLKSSIHSQHCGEIEKKKKFHEEAHVSVL